MNLPPSVSPKSVIGALEHNPHNPGHTAERSLGRSEAPESSEGLKGPDTGDRVAQALKASFQELDSHILQEEEKQGVEKGAFGGCTACVAFVMGDVSVCCAYSMPTGIAVEAFDVIPRHSQDLSPILLCNSPATQQSI